MLSVWEGIANTEFSFNHVSTSKYNPFTLVPKFLASGAFLAECVPFFPADSGRSELKYDHNRPLHVLHPSSPRSLAHEPMYSHRLTRRRPIHHGVQGCPGSLQAAPVRHGRKAQSVIGEGDTADGSFVLRKWKYVAVCDVVRVGLGDVISAGAVVLSSSEPDGLCFIEASNSYRYVHVRALGALC